MRDLTCRDATDFLADYLDGTLALAERRLFDEHLARCPDCVAYRHSYAETIRLARDAREADTLAAAVPDDLVRAILAAHPRNDDRNAHSRSGIEAGTLAARRPGAGTKGAP